MKYFKRLNPVTAGLLLILAVAMFFSDRFVPKIVTIRIDAAPGTEQVYCAGAEVAPGDHHTTVETTHWRSNWYSLGNEAFASSPDEGVSYRATLDMEEGSGRSFRFQCYLESDNTVRNACDRFGLHTGEQFAVSAPTTEVRGPTGSWCQIDL